MIKRFFLLFAIFTTFVSESIFVDLVSVPFLSDDQTVVPHFLVVAIIAVTAYTSQSFGILCGVLFGFLYDVVYTEVIGVYTFSYPVLAFLTRWALRAFHNNAFVLVLLSMLAISVLEFYTFWIYSAVGVTDLSVNMFVSNRLVPTLLLNATVSLLLIYPFKRFILSLQIEQIDD
ncbi:rod shape-determining protein MreD [Bacillus kexueae]|uniref:rod shape-determining protein MreD n=1 Tax=Aeribacillus kexueae TaxID=2078952 RepID=UPI001FAF8330|nr:rod shape-determining protein MreD [Bacillus kexueae]